MTDTAYSAVPLQDATRTSLASPAAGTGHVDLNIPSSDTITDKIIDGSENITLERKGTDVNSERNGKDELMHDDSPSAAIDTSPQVPLIKVLHQRDSSNLQASSSIPALNMSTSSSQPGQHALSKSTRSPPKKDKQSARDDSDSDAELFSKPKATKPVKKSSTNAKGKGKVLVPVRMTKREPVRMLSPMRFSDDEDDFRPMRGISDSPDPIPMSSKVAAKASKNQVSKKATARYRSDSDVDSSTDTSPKKKAKGTPTKASLSRASSSASSKPSPTKAPSTSKQERVRAPKKTSSTSPSKDKPSSSTMPSTSQLSWATSSFAAETPEQRAKGWSLSGLDTLVWVKAEHADSVFWWPADIKSKIRSERPLRLQLIEPRPPQVSGDVALEDPSPQNILSFRSMAHAGCLRFSTSNFAVAVDVDSSSSFKDAFGKALDAALALEALREDQSDESSNEKEEEEDRVDESDESDDEQLPTSSRLKKAKRGVSDDHSDDDDTLLKEQEDWELPANCLARWVTTWWPSRATERVRDSKGNLRITVECCDGTVADLPPRDILRSQQKAFFTVPVGQTKVSYPKDFEDSLRKSVRSSHDVLSSIIQDEYAPTKDWNEAFYAKGQVRHDLGNHARFGNLTEDHIDILRSALNEFLKADTRPTGCTQFQALSQSEIDDYVSYILLPMTVVMLTIEEDGLDEVAREDLGEGATEDDVAVKAVQLAQKRLDLINLPRWVHGVRAAKSTARSQLD